MITTLQYLRQQFIANHHPPLLLFTDHAVAAFNQARLEKSSEPSNKAIFQQRGEKFRHGYTETEDAFGGNRVLRELSSSSRSNTCRGGDAQRNQSYRAQDHHTVLEPVSSAPKKLELSALKQVSGRNRQADSHTWESESSGVASRLPVLQSDGWYAWQDTYDDRSGDEVAHHHPGWVSKPNEGAASVPTKAELLEQQYSHQNALLGLINTPNARFKSQNPFGVPPASVAQVKSHSSEGAVHTNAYHLHQDSCVANVDTIGGENNDRSGMLESQNRQVPVGLLHRHSFESESMKSDHTLEWASCSENSPDSHSSLSCRSYSSPVSVSFPEITRAVSSPQEQVYNKSVIEADPVGYYSDPAASRDKSGILATSGSTASDPASGSSFRQRHEALREYAFLSVRSAQDPWLLADYPELRSFRLTKDETVLDQSGWKVSTITTSGRPALHLPVSDAGPSNVLPIGMKKDDDNNENLEIDPAVPTESERALLELGLYDEIPHIWEVPDCDFADGPWCSLCNESFMDYASYESHIIEDLSHRSRANQITQDRTDSPGPPDLERPSSPSSQDTSKAMQPRPLGNDTYCDKCQIHFSNHWAMKRHLNDSKKHPYYCKTCTADWPSFTALHTVNMSTSMRF